MVLSIFKVCFASFLPFVVPKNGLAMELAVTILSLT